MDPPEPNESQTLLGAEVKPVTICKSDSVMGIKRLELEEGRGAEITKQGILAINGNEQKLQPANHKTADTANSEHQGNQNLRVASAPTTSVGSYTSFMTNSGGHHKTRVKLLKSHKSQNDSLIVMLSAIYAKLLVVVGICFPLAEVISRRIPVSYYEGFYLYLYLGSIAFLLFVYVFLLKTDPSVNHGSKLTRALAGLKSRFFTKEPVSSTEEANTQNSSSSTESLDQHASKKTADESYCCGNFYLRLGAVVFGIGSMIYSGLEFGQFFELEVGTPCYNILYGLTPTTRMAFTFVQMHFIFLNFKICIDKYVALARFGLMHLIATNLCVWLHVVVQETKHGILSLANVNISASMKFTPKNMISPVIDEQNVGTPFGKITNHSLVRRSLPNQEMYMPHECRRSNIMGELVQEASHFLFPCSIQYSLICAAILYIMWKKISGNSCIIRNPEECAGKPSVEATRNNQHYQVDCAKANKGLFTGILVLVLSIISIILFFVLIGKPEYKLVAIMEARITELVLYLLSTLAVAVALFQVRELKYNPYYNTQLDSILLIVAQSGLYVYTLFSIIGAYFAQQQNILLVLLTSLVCILQATLQTVFILDAARRYAHTSSQVHRKPGREMVTFLLVCNFAMWVVNTLQTQQTDSNPIQLSFYGFWAWTVITHVTTPLAIYFRFHSAVCLCDIWKRTYKMRREFI